MPYILGGDITYLSRHRKYYIPSGDLHFLVGTTFFRVHSDIFLSGSRYFRELVPVKGGAVHNDSPGSSDACAIVLHVQPLQFERLLRVFYTPTYSLYGSTVAEWSSVLELSNVWEFVEVKELAIRELEKLEMPDVDRIALYNQHYVDANIIVPHYVKVCTRPETLSMQEGRSLGLETALTLAAVREYARSRSTKNPTYNPLPSEVSSEDVFTIVNDLFGIPP